MLSQIIRELSLDAYGLSPNEIIEVKTRLRQHLNVEFDVPPWDNVDAPNGVFSPVGWQAIARFVGGCECLLLGERALSIWHFNCGDDLVNAIGECPPMEFYVCDPQASYLLCHNHHDYLIGWGEASDFVANYASK